VRYSSGMARNRTTPPAANCVAPPSRVCGTTSALHFRETRTCRAKVLTCLYPRDVGTTVPARARMGALWAASVNLAHRQHVTGAVGGSRTCAGPTRYASFVRRRQHFYGELAGLLSFS
jgi:hypothetical protein